MHDQNIVFRQKKYCLVTELSSNDHVMDVCRTANISLNVLMALKKAFSVLVSETIMPQQ